MRCGLIYNNSINESTQGYCQNNRVEEIAKIC